MKSFPANAFVVALLISSFSLIAAQRQEDAEVDVTGCLAPTSGRATFTVFGQQGVKGDPGPEGPHGPRGERGVRGEKGLQGAKGEKKVLVCKDIQVFLVPLVFEATLVLTVIADHMALPVCQVPEDDQVHQECL